MTNMIVKLKNLNDNPAEFNKAKYSAAFQENTVMLPFELEFDHRFGLFGFMKLLGS